jgi:hypothetical protein
VRGQHRAQLQPGDQLGGALRPHLLHGGGQRLRQRRLSGVAAAQGADAVVLLGQVGQMEVAGERAGDLHRALDGPPGGHRGDLVNRHLPPSCGDHPLAQALDVGEQLGTAVLGDHLSQQLTEQANVGTELVRHLGDGVVAFGGCDGGHDSKGSESVRTAGYRSHPLD